MAESKKADRAFRDDRERFFRECEKYTTVLYDTLTAEEQKELKIAITCWHNMTEIEGYPDIDFPLQIPSFMKPVLFSQHKKGEKQKRDPDFE